MTAPEIKVGQIWRREGGVLPYLVIYRHVDGAWHCGRRPTIGSDASIDTYLNAGTIRRHYTLVSEPQS